MSDALFRKYEPNELRADGYPEAWPEINAQAVAIAGHRCERCGHPYRKGEHGRGEWSQCDALCTHNGPLRIAANDNEAGESGELAAYDDMEQARRALGEIEHFAGMHAQRIEAKWRILTVHHLNGDKADARWWNLAPLCQRCHLTIQGRVNLAQVYVMAHSPWFQPHAAGYYAVSYLGQELTRAETMERLDELLALERADLRR